MNKLSFIFIVVVFLIHSAHAQAPSPSWVRTADGEGQEDHVSDMTIDANNNLYVVGWNQRSSTEYDYMLMKFRQDGSGKVTQAYDPGTSDFANSVNYRSGAIAVTGKGKSGSYYKIVTAKYDTNGLTNSWTQQFNPGNQNDEGIVTRIGSDGSVYVAGNYAYTSSNPKVVLLSYPSNGIGSSNTPFDFSATGTDYMADMVLGTNDTIYFVGYNVPTSGLSTLYVYKTTKTFTTLWSKSFSNVESPVSYAYKPQIRVDGSNNVYVTYWESYSGNGTATTLVLKNSDGTTTDTRRFTGRAPMDIYVNSSDQSFYVLAGYGTGPNIKVSAIKYTKSGSTWTQSWAGNCGDDGYNYIGTKIRIDSNANVYFSGTYRYDEGDSQDLLLAKLNSSGTLQWLTLFDGSYGSGADNCAAMTADALGNIYLGGTTRASLFLTSPDYLDMEIVKYNVGGSFPSQASHMERGSQNEEQFPKEIDISQNYPNPFNPDTKIRFTLPEQGRITLKIYDVLGKEVKTLIAGVNYEKGSHEVVLDASGLSSGMYFYRIFSSNSDAPIAKKMLLMK